jgi:hypothetical protein
MKSAGRAAATAIASLTVFVALTGTAGASVSMLGYHAMPREPGATCALDQYERINAWVNPPTIYATPYDNYGSQWVGWQARLVQTYTINGQTISVTRASAEQTKLAYDNTPAPFTRIGPLSVTRSFGTYRVQIDFVFYDSTTGYRVQVPMTGTVQSYNRVISDSSGRTTNFFDNKCA